MSEPVKDFTTVVPFWQPRVTPVELANATDEQLEAMKVTVSNTKIGEYTLVLALDPETLQQRTPLFNGIMYGRGRTVPRRDRVGRRCGFGGEPVHLLRRRPRQPL